MLHAIVTAVFFPGLLACAQISAASAAQPPAQPFAPGVYKARRDKLAKELGGGVAVLYSRGKEDRDGFRQDSDFHYLTGVDEPGAVLVLSPEERTYKEALFLRPRDPEDERWTGERPALGAGLRKAMGFEKIMRTSSLEARVTRLAQSARTLHAINQPGAETLASFDWSLVPRFPGSADSG